MTFYMHTIDDRPGFFNGNQICFAIVRGNGKACQRLVATLDQIRAEQKLSVRFRNSFGWEIPRYDYVKVVLPESAK